MSQWLVPWLISGLQSFSNVMSVSLLTDYVKHVHPLTLCHQSKYSANEWLFPRSLSRSRPEVLMSSRCHWSSTMTCPPTGRTTSTGETNTTARSISLLHFIVLCGNMSDFTRGWHKSKWHWYQVTDVFDMLNYSCIMMKSMRVNWL